MVQKEIFIQPNPDKEFLVDDKGSVAIAVFGLPSMSHADDARRAVTFAAEVVAALEAGGLAGRAGRLRQ